MSTATTKYRDGLNLQYSFPVQLIVLLLMLIVADLALALQPSWVARHNGSTNGDDGATAIAVDTMGRVYVTGYSATSDTSAVFTTIKYDTSGNEVWVRHYSSAANKESGASAIAVDAAGNIYVTGYSATSDTASVFVTIRYDPSGAQRWVALYTNLSTAENGATAIAADHTGNVLVTGYSGDAKTGMDYATIKYDSTGAEVWVRRYNGSANQEDSPSVITIDDSGNVYVTGYSFDSDTSSSFATIKYSSAGAEGWVRRYGVPARFAGASAIAIDDSANVYVTGYSFDSDTSSAYTTIKYSAAGQQQWLVRYNGLAHRENAATAIAVGSRATGSNVYITGYSIISDTTSVYATVKYDSSGVEQWIRQFGGPGNADNQPAAIAVDDSGSVYVTGAGSTAVGGPDYATIKYNAAGDSIWIQVYDGPGNSEDGAVAITLGRAQTHNTAYVTGYSTGAGTGTDFATIKYHMGGGGEPVPIKQTDK